MALVRSAASVDKRPATMQHNQVFVIQVSSGSKVPLALPAPPDALLPSEVKYSASLVRGLGCTHLILGTVIFLLGVLGTWVEPETCWAGAGVWMGLSALLCGLSGLLAHCLWYKNFSIKAFLVTSVVCVVLSVLAIILSIYAIVNRHQHFQKLLEQIEQHTWFQPYDLNKEHRLTLNVSVNLLVGFFLELILALWSTKVGWRGVQTPEFSATKRDCDVTDQQSVTPLPRPGQQVPLAALYQLLQAHPEMLGNKSMEAGLVSPWVAGLGEHPSHHSMDYQERVNRFLSHAIEDQNPCLTRSLSVLQSEHQGDCSSATTSTLGSGGRGSPTDTLPMLPDHTRSGKQGREVPQGNLTSERKVKYTHVDTLKQRKGSEPKVKAPAPKLNTSMKNHENSTLKETPKKFSVKDETKKIEEIVDEKSHKDSKSEKKSMKSPAVDTEEKTNIQNNTKPVPETSEPDIHKEPDKTEKQKTKVKEMGNVNAQDMKQKSSPEDKAKDIIVNNKDSANNKSDTEERESTKSTISELEKCSSEGIYIDMLSLITDIQPPCEFQDTT